MSEYGNEYNGEDDHDQPFDKEEHYEPRFQDEPYDHDGNTNPDYIDRNQPVPVKNPEDYQEEDIPKEREDVYELIDEVPIPQPTGIHFIEELITSIAPSTDSKVNGEHKPPTFKSILADLGLKRGNDDETHEKGEAEDNIYDIDKKKEDNEFYGVLDTETTKKKENEFNGVFDTETKKENEKHKGEDPFDEKDEVKDG